VHTYFILDDNYLALGDRGTHCATWAQSSQICRILFCCHVYGATFSAHKYTPKMLMTDWGWVSSGQWVISLRCQKTCRLLLVFQSTRSDIDKCIWARLG